MRKKVHSIELLPHTIFYQVETDMIFFCPLPYSSKSFFSARSTIYEEITWEGCVWSPPWPQRRLPMYEKENDREQLDGRSTASSKACRFTYFHPLSRGYQIRNNQNPAGNNIRHLNWVGCATDVSSVSLGGSFFDFLKNTKNSFTFMVHLFYITTDTVRK